MAELAVAIVYKTSQGVVNHQGMDSGFLSLPLNHSTNDIIRPETELVSLQKSQKEKKALCS